MFYVTPIPYFFFTFSEKLKKYSDTHYLCPDMMDGCCARKNSYELYGADFMLTTDLRPWLLEINSSPALGATTSITSRLCSAVLEDVIKVTVDKARNRTADTGGWELVYRSPTSQNKHHFHSFSLKNYPSYTHFTYHIIIYLIRQPAVQQPQYSGISLTVQGTKIQMSQRLEHR